MYHWHRRNGNRGAAVALLLAGALLAGACTSTHQVADQGKEAMRHGNWDGAVYYYLEALAHDPENVQYKMALIRARQKASEEHFKRGVTYRKLGKLIAARDEFRMAIELDPTHQFAEQQLKSVQKEIDILSEPEGKKSLEEMKRKAREAKVKPPILNPRSKEPITLSFPRPTPVKEIYRALAKAFGFNVLFDPKLKDDKITVELNDVTAKRALETVMQAAGHFYKVLDEHSIIVADDTPQNRRKYEDLVIKTFFLSNAEVKDIDKLLRSLIEARRLATNEQLNAITLRDTADKVAIAEKLISTNDKAKAEVMLDVELMEVNAAKLRSLGMQLSEYTFTLGLDPTGVAADPEKGIHLDELKNISRGDWTINVPSIIIRLIKNSADAVSLAQPQMRITEGEKGQLMIGNREPIPVTTFNTSNTIGGNVVPITSYQYQDVGIKIEVEPRVHHNREITLKLKVEVSNINGYTDANYPIIGTRTISTVIRLMDGETSMLVGLYKEDTAEGSTEIPLISQIPFIGRLFTQKSHASKTTDLVLTLTPHIIRFPDIQEEDLQPLWVGTESRISYFGSSPRVHSGSQATGPFDKGPAGGKGRKERPDRSSSSRTAMPRKSTPQAGGRLQGLPRGGKIQLPGIPLPGATKQDATPSAGGGPGDEAEVRAEPAPGGAAEPAIVLAPEVISTTEDEPVRVALVGQGLEPGSPVVLTVSFDPTRLRLDSVDPVEDVMVESQHAPGTGWVSLRIVPGEAYRGGGELAHLVLTPLAPGTAPLVLGGGTAVKGEGTTVPVAVAGASVTIADDGGEAGDANPPR